MYSGEGILYNQGVMVYKGNFSKNLFDGEGEQYNSEGKLQYKGDFKLGQRSGNGIEYDIETAKKIYSGVWAENLREGEGIEFKNDGVTKIYKGAFSAGLYDGNGSLYENGKLKYQGEFSSGVYEGEGTLYDIDTGNVIYVGAFAGGKYEGEGKLFDVNTKKVVYSGNFSAGMREGEGESYDKLGAATYKGEFSEDDMAYFNYFGKKFDEISSEFGRESFKSAVEDKLIVTYRNKNISMLFKENAEDKSYTCEKIFVNLKNTTFKGLSNKSSQEEIKNLMGNVYSSIDYKFDSTYDALFQSLAVDIKSGVSYPSDKFIMENYFVRFYYDTNREKILSVEISLV